MQNLKEKIANNITDITFSKEGLAEIVVNGKSFCLAKHNDQLFACAAKCPHAGTPLTEGYIDPLGNIVCRCIIIGSHLKTEGMLVGKGIF
jgi:3-phenylpropionate/trans-cinnamate dioxygenase ferredoxin subunit